MYEAVDRYAYRFGRNCKDCGIVLSKANAVKSCAKHLCKPCFNARQRAWRIKTPELAKARSLRDYAKNKESIIARVSKWAKANPEKRRRANVTWRWKIRLKMIEAYGGKCMCCGESEPAFLTIDHTRNDGYIKRKNGERVGASLYSALRDAGWPKDNYQLLCMNCNFAKGHFGYCPHKKMRQRYERIPFRQRLQEKG